MKARHLLVLMAIGVLGCDASIPMPVSTSTSPQKQEAGYFCPGCKAWHNYPRPEPPHVETLENKAFKLYQQQKFPLDDRNMTFDGPEATDEEIDEAKVVLNRMIKHYFESINPDPRVQSYLESVAMMAPNPSQALKEQRQSTESYRRDTQEALRLIPDICGLIQEKRWPRYNGRGFSATYGINRWNTHSPPSPGEELGRALGEILWYLERIERNTRR